MEIKTLTKENFLIYAIGNYTNSDCIDMSEFYEDLAKIKYIKRLLKKYKRTGKIRCLLVLNHIIVFANVFGIRASSQMLFYKLESELHSVLKTILMYLNYIQDNEQMYFVSLNDVPLDAKLYLLLKKTVTNEK